MGDGPVSVDGSIHIVYDEWLFQGLVPIDNVLMARGSMKLCVALQSSSASIWVVLCHMLTVNEIVIEFFCVLYMWATDAGVLATVKLRQTKNPDPDRKSVV